MSRKTQYVENIMKIMEYLGQVGDVAADRHKEYFDRTYGSGGANEIVDADLTAYDLTAAEFTSAVTLLEQVKNLVGNSAVTQADYAATLNKVRRTIGSNTFYDLKL